MASPLHKTPIGLLELFRLRTLGRAPEAFGDTVLPVIDVAQTYAAPEMQTTGGGAIVGTISAAAGVTSTVQVAAFTWLWGVGGNIIIGAAPGTSILWAVGVAIPGQVSEYVFGCGQLSTFVAGAIIQFGAPLPKPIVLPAGSRWFCRVRGDAAGADHSVQVTALYVPAANLN